MYSEALVYEKMLLSASLLTMDNHYISVRISFLSLQLAACLGFRALGCALTIV